MLTLEEPVHWRYANICTSFFKHTLLEFTKLTAVRLLLFFFSHLPVDPTPTPSDICCFNKAKAEDTNKRGKRVSRRDPYMWLPFWASIALTLSFVLRTKPHWIESKEHHDIKSVVIKVRSTEGTGRNSFFLFFLSFLLFSSPFPSFVLPFLGHLGMAFRI